MYGNSTTSEITNALMQENANCAIKWNDNAATSGHAVVTFECPTYSDMAVFSDNGAMQIVNNNSEHLAVYDEELVSEGVEARLVICNQVFNLPIHPGNGEIIILPIFHI